MGIYINEKCCNNRLYKGCHHLDSETTVTCIDADADTYYKIGGTWIDECNDGFTYDGTGKLTYNGINAVTFLFIGTSDLKVNKACSINYALYKNGVIVGNVTTPHTFDVLNKVSNISVTNFIKLNKDDYLEVYVKSDEANTQINVQTLSLTLTGEL